MSHDFLEDLVLVLAVSVVSVYVLGKLKLPSLAGFLLTGAVVGPHGLRLIAGVQQVERIAEVGAVFLLFSVGVDFSLGRLARIRREVLLGGSLQVVLTGAAFAGLALVLGQPLNRALFFGCLASVSSTTIVMRLLTDRGELESPHGRVSVGISIFQDLCIVPMMLLVPVLSTGRRGNLLDILNASGVALGMIIIVLIAARRLVPWLLHQVVMTRSRELFLLTVLVFCLGTAYLTSRVGLSLALGAFLAGLIVSESEYSHQVLGDILPLRDAFNSLFFVSVGMLLDGSLMITRPVLVVLVVLAVLALKSTIAGAAVLLLGYPLRVALLAGFTLAQVGEFSFVLSRAGMEYDLFGGGSGEQLFLVASVVTMMLTPILTGIAPVVAGRLGARGATLAHGAPREPRWRDHVILAGYGLGGQSVARVLSDVGIPHVVMELNAKTVRRERTRGIPIVYGDATSPDMLHRVAVEHARVLVVVISDTPSALRITQLARRLNPGVHIIVRTRYVHEIEALIKDGADEVIPEEFESSIEVFTHVLQKYLVPRTEIARAVTETRRNAYEMLRSIPGSSPSALSLSQMLPGIEVGTERVMKDSKVARKTLRELELRSQFATTVIAIQRGDRLRPNPGPNELLEEQDLVLLIGTPEQLDQVAPLFRAPPVARAEPAG
ncbi:MAG: cation:proton antiporter [Planctomycetota bacterium]